MRPNVGGVFTGEKSWVIEKLISTAINSWKIFRKIKKMYFRFSVFVFLVILKFYII